MKAAASMSWSYSSIQSVIGLALGHVSRIDMYRYPSTMCIEILLLLPTSIVAAALFIVVPVIHKVQFCMHVVGASSIIVITL